MRDTESALNDIFAQMPSRLNADTAAGMDCVLQYDLTGDAGRSSYATIKDGVCTVSEGSHDSPSMTVTMEAADFVALTSGELDGTEYDGADGLNMAVRNHPKLPYCLVNRLYAYGTGGPVSLRYDRDILAYFSQRFAAHGYKVPELLRDLTLSQAFSQVRRNPESAATVANVKRTPPSQIARNQQ